MKKRFISLLIVLSIFICCLPTNISIVMASTNGHTQQDAVNWITARADEKWWSDIDGWYGCQCVDLIMAYYDYLVGYRVSGHACDYISNTLPSGWYRDQTPSVGSIIV